MELKYEACVEFVSRRAVLVGGGVSTGPAPFFLLVPLTGLTCSGYCCRTLLHWGTYVVFTCVYTDAHRCIHAYMDVHRCSPLCSQATELSHGSADWKSNVQGWQVPCLVGI